MSIGECFALKDKEIIFQQRQVYKTNNTQFQPKLCHCEKLLKKCFSFSCVSISRLLRQINMPGADQNIKTEVYQIKPTDLELQPIVFLSEMKCNPTPGLTAPLLQTAHTRSGGRVEEGNIANCEPMFCILINYREAVYNKHVIGYSKAKGLLKLNDPTAFLKVKPYRVQRFNLFGLQRCDLQAMLNGNIEFLGRMHVRTFSF